MLTNTQLQTEVQNLEAILKEFLEQYKQMTTKHLTMEEIDVIMEQNPEPKDVSFRQIKIQEKSSDDWRSFLSFYSKETNVIYRLRGYGATPGEAADDAWKTFNDEELRWHEIDSYERYT